MGEKCRDMPAVRYAWASFCFLSFSFMLRRGVVLLSMTVVEPAPSVVDSSVDLNGW